MKEIDPFSKDPNETIRLTLTLDQYRFLQKLLFKTHLFNSVGEIKDEGCTDYWVLNVYQLKTNAWTNADMEENIKILDLLATNEESRDEIRKRTVMN